MRPVRWPRLNLRILFAIPIAIAIVHIASTLSRNADSSISAYARLKPIMRTNELTVMAPLGPKNQPLPFLTPDSRYAICQFDTSLGAVDLNATLFESGWTLTVYDSNGVTLYASTGSDEAPLDVSVRMMPVDNRFLGLSSEAFGTDIEDRSRITVTAANGMAVLRAPDKGSAYAQISLQQLSGARCAARRQK